MKIDKVEFCKVWNNAAEVADVAQYFGVEKSVCQSLKMSLKKLGVPLKDFPRGRKGISGTELQALIDAAKNA